MAGMTQQFAKGYLAEQHFGTQPFPLESNWCKAELYQCKHNQNTWHQ